MGQELRLPNGQSMVRHKDLTKDHKPNTPEERERIESAGGVVVFDGAWNHRVYARKKDKNGKSYPGLNMSRAMGDLMGFHDAGISATPDLSEHAVRVDSTTDKFMIIASDGIWEFVSSSQAVRIANGYERMNAQDAAEALAGVAWDQWVKELNGEVVDDITCLVVHLQGRPEEQILDGTYNSSNRADSKDLASGEDLPSDRLEKPSLTPAWNRASGASEGSEPSPQ